MSTGVIDSPIQSVSQLCFAWANEQAHEQVQQDPAPASANFKAQVRPSRSRSTTHPRALSGSTQVVARATVKETEGCERLTAETHLPHAVHQSSYPAAPLAVRGNEEVRIGTVMIKLLKRYGITDAEIADGIASYAQKRCQSSAS